MWSYVIICVTVYFILPRATANQGAPSNIKLPPAGSTSKWETFKASCAFEGQDCSWWRNLWHGEIHQDGPWLGTYLANQWVFVGAVSISHDIYLAIRGYWPSSSFAWAWWPGGCRAQVRTHSPSCPGVSYLTSRLLNGKRTAGIMSHEEFLIGHSTRIRGSSQGKQRRDPSPLGSPSRPPPAPERRWPCFHSHSWPPGLALSVARSLAIFRDIPQFDGRWLVKMMIDHWTNSRLLVSGDGSASSQCIFDSLEVHRVGWLEVGT